MTHHHGVITAKEEFLYPDSELSALPDRVTIDVAKNGKAGIQILLETMEHSGSIRISGNEFDVEYFQMLDVPVEYNTGDDENQAGQMVLMEPSQVCPPYATRKAPFRVYDCLKPVPGPEICCTKQRLAAYLCLSPRPDTKPGHYELLLQVCTGCFVHRCVIAICVHSVWIPLDEFQVTNWFSLDAISRFHHVNPRTEGFLEMLHLYAKAMRRAHQTAFLIEIDKECLISQSPYQFRFEHLKPVIRCFFQEGFRTLEIAGILSCGYLPNGAQDKKTDSLKCALLPHIAADSEEGYFYLSALMRDLGTFLQENSWTEQQLLLHVMDEPDEHCPDEHTLQARRVQYYMAANLARRYIPNVKIIEAVKSTAFRGAIDIMVPVVSGYQKNKEEFDKMIRFGDELWGYVCCTPEGFWLNRFLDFALLRGRLLFWGCAANAMSGFLHWGFNQFLPGMNPFEGTSGRNTSGIGTDFPCGDAFIVYPGTDGPWLSMRLEAARQGAEDACLLRRASALQSEKCKEVIASVFESFRNYNADPERFSDTYKNLLTLFEQIEG